MTNTAVKFNGYRIMKQRSTEKYDPDSVSWFTLSSLGQWLTEQNSGFCHPRTLPCTPQTRTRFVGANNSELKLE